MFVAGFIGEPPMNFVHSSVEGGCASVLDVKCDLSNILASNELRAYEGKPVAFGFRPEGIVLGAVENAYVFDANVVLTELLGDNTNVYVEVGDVSLILKVDPHQTPKLDTKITFSVPYENAYLFDGNTEVVIKKK